MRKPVQLKMCNRFKSANIARKKIKVEDLEIAMEVKSVGDLEIAEEVENLVV